MTGLLVSAAGTVVDWMSSALAEAAKQDREGKATKGTSPAYLWWYQTDKQTRGLMSCAVVTLSQSHPKTWCETEGPFKKDAQNVCDYFKAGDSPANQPPMLSPASWSKKNDLPAFYAEIALEASADKRGVLPKLVALYYPKGIHGGKFANAQPRTIQLTVSAATPDGTSALGSLVVRLDKAVPNEKVQLDNEIASGGARVWAAALGLPEKYTPPESSGSIFPVNVSAEVREIGDPNKFLQALAAAFVSQKDAIKEELKAKIVAATTEADPAAAQSAYDAQAAAVYAAEAKVRAACKPAAPATRNSSAVRSEYLGLLEAHRKLEALPKPAKMIEFNPTHDALKLLYGGAADAICTTFP